MKINYIINNVYENLPESDKEKNFNIKILKVITIFEQLKEDYDI